jgi:hypothetical protein
MVLSNIQVASLAKILKISLAAICLQENLQLMEIEDNTGYIINGGTHYVCMNSSR